MEKPIQFNEHERALHHAIESLIMNAHRMSNEGVCANLGTIRELFLRCASLRNDASDDAEFYANLVSDLRQDSKAYSLGRDDGRAELLDASDSFRVHPGQMMTWNDDVEGFCLQFVNHKDSTAKQVTIIVEVVDDGKKPFRVEGQEDPQGQEGQG